MLEEYRNNIIMTGWEELYETLPFAHGMAIASMILLQSWLLLLQDLHKNRAIIRSLWMIEALMRIHVPGSLTCSNLTSIGLKQVPLHGCRLSQWIYYIVLAFPIPWDMFCNLGLNFSASNNGLSKPLCRDFKAVSHFLHWLSEIMDKDIMIPLFWHHPAFKTSAVWAAVPNSAFS